MARRVTCPVCDQTVRVNSAGLMKLHWVLKAVPRTNQHNSNQPVRITCRGSGMTVTWN